MSEDPRLKSATGKVALEPVLEGQRAEEHRVLDYATPAKVKYSTETRLTAAVAAVFCLAGAMLGSVILLIGVGAAVMDILDHQAVVSPEICFALAGVILLLLSVKGMRAALRVVF